MKKTIANWLRALADALDPSGGASTMGGGPSNPKPPV